MKKLLNIEFGERLLVIGGLVNLLLAVTKITTGLLGHSNVLLADGAESMIDVFSTVMIWMALRYAAKPPDQDHPYGHGKAESLAALIAGGVLLGVGLLIAIFSITQLVAVAHGHHPRAPKLYTLMVLITVIIFKEILFRLIARRAKQIRSSAMLAEALHHRSDMIISLTALIGISITLIGGAGYENADDWAALGACFIIFYNAFIIIKSSLGEMMDARVNISETLLEMACEVEGVRSAEKCRVRKSGLSLIADLHIRVNAEETVREGHAISHAVKDQIINSELGVNDVTVHLEPDKI